MILVLTSFLEEESRSFLEKNIRDSDSSPFLKFEA
jgi:hypothetical protein